MNQLRCGWAGQHSANVRIVSELRLDDQTGCLTFAPFADSEQSRNTSLSEPARLECRDTRVPLKAQVTFGVSVANQS